MPVILVLLLLLACLGSLAGVIKLGVGLALIGVLVGLLVGGGTMMAGLLMLGLLGMVLYSALEFVALAALMTVLSGGIWYAISWLIRRTRTFHLP